MDRYRFKIIVLLGIIFFISNVNLFAQNNVGDDDENMYTFNG